MSDNNVDKEFIHIDSGKKFIILKKGKEYFIKALDKGVDLNEVNHLLVRYNIQVTNFINIRNAISSKINEVVPFGTEKEKIVVTISNDNMKAYVTFYMAESELANRAKLVKELQFALEEKGVIHGVDYPRILKADKVPSNANICIAEGTPAIPGEDSVVNLHEYTAEFKPKEVDGGKVDHYQIGIVNHIQQDEWIGDWTLPTEGIPGMTVLGKPVKPDRGKPAKILYDKKSIYEIQDGNKISIYARYNGAMKIEPNGCVVIANHLMVENVDFSTGNIDFDGSVTINGTIEDGFSVIARENIEIKGDQGIGCVKEIVSKEGNVLLCGGINGRGKSVIRAMNITSKYISNANIFAEETLSVKNYILNSCVEAKEIIMDNPSAQIAGGEIKNCSKIVTGLLGNETELKTNIDLRELNKEILEKRLMEITNDIEENKIKIIKLDKLSSDPAMPPEKVEQLINLKSEVNYSNDILEREFVNIKRALGMRGSAEIKLYKYVYSGVRINTVNESKFITKKTVVTNILSKEGYLSMS